MKQLWNWGLLVVAGLLLVGAGLMLMGTRSGPAGTGHPAGDLTAPVPTDPALLGEPPPQAVPGSKPGGGHGQTGPRPRVSERAEEMTADERAEFEKNFAMKLKPAVERWCEVYAGHTPFRPEEVTADKLRQVVFPGSPAQGYGFVVNGTTLCIEDDRGNVYLQYIMAPAARQLEQLPRGAAPLEQVSITRQEIIRLLKADSGKDFPPNEVAITPTSWSGAMNGGVYVDAGKEVHSLSRPPPEYSMVFGPDGNLACYLRAIIPSRGAGGKR